MASNTIADQGKVSSIIFDLIKDNPVIGYPVDKPANIKPFKHGWFYNANRQVLDRLITEETTCVIELGSWLGTSALFISEKASNAAVFAIDIWSNDFLLNDQHYNKSSENISILNGPPIYEQFLVNTWEHRYGPKNKSSNDQTVEPNIIDVGINSGIVPIKMDSVEAMKLLKEKGIRPDLIYIDANHHYEPVIRDVEACLELFPGAHLVGDDWDYKEVRDAVNFVAKKYSKKVFVHRKKCWTFSFDEASELVEKESREIEEENKKRSEKRKLDKMLSGSLSSLMQNYSAMKKK